MKCKLPEHLLGIVGSTLLIALSWGEAAEANVLSPALIRFPNSDGTQIVFSARGHLWMVAKTGGAARQLTNGSGYEIAPRFSPDGHWIAFTGNRGGAQDVYLMPASGGVPRRLTWLSVPPLSNGVRRASQEGLVVAWAPDSRGIVFLSRQSAWNSAQYRPFTVVVTGGQPVPLPIDRSGYLSFGPDGRSFAFNRTFNEFKTWKRYDGGQAQDVEIYDPSTKQLEQITHWRGNDATPMWVGNRIYFVSDRDAHRRANIWVYDRTTRLTRAVTHFTDYDIDIPSAGGNAITFQQGGRLWALDLGSETLREVPVMVPDDGSRTAPRIVSVNDMIRDEDTDYDTDYRLSPDGRTAVFAARGDIFTVSADGGAPFNLTASSNAEEDHPVWSPDGSTIAYTTDASGEQQLAMRGAAGGPERQLTHFASGFLFEPLWSPDARNIAIHDGAHRLWLVPVDGGAPQAIAYNRDHYMHETDEHDAVFSPDARWLAFSTSLPTRLRALHFYYIATGMDTIVSAPDESDYRPAFSPDGLYLYFVSDRRAISVQSDRETNAVTVKSGGIYVASLSAGTPPRFQPVTSGPPLSNQQPSAQPGPTQPAPTQGARRDEQHPERDIDLAGLMQRAVPVPVEPAKIVSLETRGSALFYRTQPPDTLAGSLPGETGELHRYDLAASHDEVVVKDLDSNELSGDGRRVLYKLHDDWRVADATAGAPHAVTLDLSRLQARIDPRQEWREMFENSWRLERDMFVNANMNGTDWQSVHDSYAKLLPLVATRDDLNYLIGQVIAELGSSHTYVGGGDDGQALSSSVTALLGADYTLDPASGRYRFGRIYRGDSTRGVDRGPLGWPGLNIKEGDYLLAIAGQELAAPAVPAALLAGHYRSVAITVASSSTGPRRDVTIVPVTSEYAIRRLDWVRRNQQLVDQLSDGRIGYMYVADMENLGMEEFIRGFYSQLGKQALIVDERWNGGGNTDQIVLERLRRTLSSMQTMRDRVPQTQPDQLQIGPKAMLINNFAGSDGDMFPYHFRAYGLGKIIGTRTWGGVRGIRTFWTLLDGGFITIPEITFYGRDGQWAVENHGVDPDIAIEDRPNEYQTGGDVQLATAVQSLLGELPPRPYTIVPPPPVPVYAPVEKVQRTAEPGESAGSVRQRNISQTGGSHS